MSKGPRRPLPDDAADADAARVDTEPRWLSPREQDAWLATAALMTRLPAELDARLQRESALTFFEYMVLAMLSMAPDRTLRMHAAASATSASLSRVSHVVRRLEDRGLVIRRRVPGAGRRTTATLTESGFVVVAEAAPGHVRAVRKLFIDVLEPRDLDALERIGGAVGAAVDATQRLAGEPDP